MSEKLAPVVLRCEIEINGRTYSYQQAITPRDWKAIEQDPDLRATAENMLRARFGALIAGQLRPPITVHPPTGLDEAVMKRAVDELPD